jgi:hypothetical protein
MKKTIIENSRLISKTFVKEKFQDLLPYFDMVWSAMESYLEEAVGNKDIQKTELFDEKLSSIPSFGLIGQSMQSDLQLFSQLCYVFTCSLGDLSALKTKSTEDDIKKALTKYSKKCNASKQMLEGFLEWAPKFLTNLPDPMLGKTANAVGYIATTILYIDEKSQNTRKPVTKVEIEIMAKNNWNTYINIPFRKIYMRNADGRKGPNVFNFLQRQQIKIFIYLLKESPRTCTYLELASVFSSKHPETRVPADIAKEIVYIRKAIKKSGLSWGSINTDRGYYATEALIPACIIENAAEEVKTTSFA